MITLGLFLAMLLTVLYGFFRGWRRGMGKSIFHVGTILVRIILSIVLCRLTFSVGMDMAQQTLLETVPELNDLFSDPALIDFAVAMVQMLLSAFVFLLYYLVLGFVLKPLELLIRRIAFGKHKRSWIGGAVGAFGALLVITALYSPINGMVHIASRVIYAVEEVEYGEALPTDSANVASVALSTVAEVDRSPALRAQRTLGGKAFFSLITGVNYQETKTNLNVESEAVVNMIGATMKLSEKPTDQWNQTEIEEIRKIATFGQSRILPQAASSLLGSMNEKWSAGQTFCGIEKPALPEMIAPTFDLLLRSLGTSTPDEICHTLSSMVDMVGVLYNHNAVSILSSGAGSDQMVALLSDDALLPDLMDCMYNDRNLRVCVPELINIGLRAVGDSMGIPADKEALYENFMTDISNKFNADIGKSRAERLESLTDGLMQVSDSYGLCMTESGALYVATHLIQDLGDQAVTPDMVEAWFVDYANNATVEGETGSATPTVARTPATGLSTVQSSATFAGALPTHTMTFTYVKGGTTVTVTLYTRTDGSLLVQEKGIDGFCQSTWTSAQQFCFSLQNALSLTVQQGKIAGYTSTLPSFTVTDLPRTPSSAEAALVNASFTLPATAEEALEELQTMLPAFANGDQLILPACIHNALALPETDSRTMSVEAFLDQVSACANKTGFSTGNATTLQTAQDWNTHRVTLSDMTLDSERVANNLPNLNKDKITESLSNVMKAAASILAPEEGETMKVEEALQALTGIQGAIEELDRDPVSSPTAQQKPSANQAILNGLLQSDTIKDSLPVEDNVVGELSGALTESGTDTTAVLNDMTKLINTIVAVSRNEASSDTITADLEQVLRELSPDSAKVISKLFTVEFLTSLGMQEATANDLAPLCAGFFGDLSAITDPEEFQKEAKALQVLIDLALKAKEANGTSDHLFGTDGALGMTAEDLLDSLMGSKVLTHSLLKVTMPNVYGKHFVLRAGALEFLSANLTDTDKSAMQAAITAYWNENKDACPTATLPTDLFFSSGTYTKTDLARRLTALSILFRLVDETTDYATLFEGANTLSGADVALQTITVKTKDNSGSLTFSLLSSGTVCVTFTDGGIAGLLTVDQGFDPQALPQALALRLSITEGAISWNLQKEDTNLLVYTKDLLAKN